MMARSGCYFTAFSSLQIIFSLCVKTWATGTSNSSESAALKHSVLNEELSFSMVLDPLEKYRLYWDFNDTHVTFEVNVETLGYVGLGISPNGGMPGSDIVIAWVDDLTGEASLSDRYATAKAEPEVDKVQDYELLKGYQNASHTVIRIRRPLTLCDSNDKSIQIDTVRLIWSYHAEDPDVNGHVQYHGVNRGVRSIFLLNPTKSKPKIPREIFTQDLLNDRFELPARDTYYNCRSFELPKFDRKHHLIGVKPIIQEGHESHVHHITVFGCVDPVANSSINVQHECFTRDMPVDWWNCNAMYLGWAIGGGDVFLPEHIGFPFGTDEDPTIFLMQTHYDNQQLKTGMVDSSGLRLVYTRQLRQHDGGIIMTGTNSKPTQIIPPFESSFMSRYHCMPDCWAEAMDGKTSEIKVIGALLHSHIIGRAIRVRHFRQGVELEPIVEDMNYDFNLQETRFLKNEVTIMPGDFTVIECFYNSLGRRNLTLGGLSTSEEMCFGFLLYYPKVPMSVCLTLPRPSFLAKFAGITVTDDWTIRAPESLANQKLVPLLNDIVDWKNETIRMAFQALVAMSEADSYYSVCQHGTIRHPSHLSIVTPPDIPEYFQPYRGQCLVSSKASFPGTTPAPILLITCFLCGIYMHLKSADIGFA